jgi:hypothetical protein
MQPAQGIFFIHEAIMKEAVELETAVQTARGALDAAALPERLQFFGRVLKVHTDAEAGSLFVDLESKVPGVRDGYLHDHDEEQKLVAETVATARDSASQWNNASQAKLGAAVSRLRGHVDSHISKENEVIVPLIMKLFSPQEQGAQAGRMIALIPQPELMKLVPWMMQRLTPERRVDYVKMMAGMSPPEQFKGFAKGLQAALPAEAWSALTKAVPQLTA